MVSPKDRYENDVQYRQLCDLIEGFLHQAQFTPSEVRECAVMACIHYEMRHAFKHYTVPISINRALHELDEWRSGIEKEEPQHG